MPCVCQCVLHGSGLGRDLPRSLAASGESTAVRSAFSQVDSERQAAPELGVARTTLREWRAERSAQRWRRNWRHSRLLTHARAVLHIVVIDAFKSCPDDTCSKTYLRESQLISVCNANHSSTCSVPVSNRSRRVALFFVVSNACAVTVQALPVIPARMPGSRRHGWRIRVGSLNGYLARASVAAPWLNLAHGRGLWATRLHPSDPIETPRIDSVIP